MPTGASGTHDEKAVAPIRVFVVDDHELLRLGVREVLRHEEDIEVVGEAATAEEAVRLIARLRPQVVVLDVLLGGIRTGIDVCRDIKAFSSDIACIIFTGLQDDRSLADAIMAGASGYVAKGGMVDLPDIIRRVAKGESLLDSSSVAEVLHRLTKESEDPYAGLSHQERRIFGFIAEGRTNKEIAVAMYLSEKTVKNYVSNLLGKLGVRRRVEAAALAARVQEQQRVRQQDGQ